MRSKRRIISAALTALLIVGTLAACGGSASDSNYKASYSPEMAYETSAAADYGWYDGEPGEYTKSGDTGKPDAAQANARKLIKDVSMRIETKEFTDFVASIEGRAASLGGYIEASSVDGNSYYSDYYHRTAEITVRIPADKLDTFTNGIAESANITSRSDTVRDVTASYYDIESHVKALRSEYDTLLKILEKCTEVKDVISVQSQITNVLYQIESYQSTLNHYDDLVSYSTVTMNIREVERERIVTKQTIGGRIASGIRETFADIGENAGDFAVWFVVNLPYLIIWAIILTAAFFVIRKIYRAWKKKHDAKQAAYQEAMRRQREAAMAQQTRPQSQPVPPAQPPRQG